MGDRAAVDAAARAAAAAWALDEPMVLRVAMNGIYTAGSTVLRVSRPSAPPDAALQLHDALRSHGIPVAQPARREVFTSGTLAVTCWERVEVVAAPVDWRAVGAIVRRVHGIDGAALPERYPLVAPSDLPWWDFDRLLADCGDRLDPLARAGIDAAIGRHAGWQSWERSQPTVVCHGDVHPGNILMTRAGPLLLDWDLMSRAPAGWDHGPLLTWTDRWGGAPGLYEQFVEGYGLDLRDDPMASGYAELRLVAATLMRVIAANREPAAGPEAERRLAYWRGDPDAPAWTAQ